MPTYITFYYAPEDLDMHLELDEEGWVLRQIEIRKGTASAVTAASRAEVLELRDRSDWAGMRRYEFRYGGLAEVPLSGQQLEQVRASSLPAAWFEELWVSARYELTAGAPTTSPAP